MELKELLERFKAYAPHVDTTAIELAYEYSVNAHADQARASGEHYFVHCSAVAESLIELKLDMPTICAGLLHDVGKLVLASNYPEQYVEIGRNAQAKRVEWLVEERESFGFDHADVGGYLLGLWGLPPAVVEAVAFHHFPLRSCFPCRNRFATILTVKF